MVPPEAAEGVELRVHRNVYFRDQFVFEGLNYSGLGLLFQVRRYRDAPGPALLTLEVVADIAAADGLQITADTSGTQPVTTVDLRAHYNKIQLLPGANDINEDVVLDWDLISNGSGGEMFKIAGGPFVVVGGVGRLA